MPAINESAAWAAVSSRDSKWDRRLVYGVTSTRIYCRPSCPSRRPRRDRVRFFTTSELAETAGFRACKRCQPNVAPGASPAEVAVQRALTHLNQQADERVSLAELGRVAGMSPFHLQRTFKRLVGLTPREYLAARRADRLRR